MKEDTDTTQFIEGDKVVVVNGIAPTPECDSCVDRVLGADTSLLKTPSTVERLSSCRNSFGDCYSIKSTISGWWAIHGSRLRLVKGN